MMIVACYLLSGSCVSLIHDFGIITMLFSGTLLSGVRSENNGVVLPKSRMKDIGVRNQITCDSRYS
jgi:hypothetical protein